jgi:serine/threonine protein kinase
MRDFCSKCLVRSPTERAAAQDLLTHPWIAEEVELARGDVGSFALKALVDQHWEGISSSRVVRRKSVAIGSADKAQPQLDNHALRNKVSLMKVSQAISAKERPAYVFENTDGDTDGITLNFNYEDTFKATTGQRRRSSMLSQDSQGTDEGTLPFGVRKGSIFADAITETYRLNAEDITGINITEIAMVEAIPDFRDKNVYTGVNPGDLYGRTKVLGRGSYGVVYQGRNLVSGEEIAIKVLPCPHPSDVGQEIEILRRLDNPFIVNFYQAFLGNKELWIVMEFCGGGSLADVLKHMKITLNEEQVVGITASCVMGLTYLHGLLGIHRDIKAGNILLSGDGEAKLADFGVSAQLKHTLQQRNTLIGTPFWMAPEVIQENDYDYKADIWSLGITILELCEGHPPHFDLHPMRAVFLIPMAKAPTLKEPDKWSSSMVQFLAKCLEKYPNDRASILDLSTHNWIHASVIAIQQKGKLEVLKELAEAAVANVEGRGDAALEEET